MLKQLQFFALPEAWEPPADLEAALDPHRIQPILACEQIRTGFESLPVVDTLTHSGMGATLFAVAVDRKRVPAQVLRREVARLSDAATALFGVKPNKRERQQIKDGALADLLSRAFAVPPSSASTKSTELPATNSPADLPRAIRSRMMPAIDGEPIASTGSEPSAGRSVRITRSAADSLAVPITSIFSDVSR